MGKSDTETNGQMVRTLHLHFKLAGSSSAVFNLFDGPDLQGPSFLSPKKLTQTDRHPQNSY
jgi:hypothetical protein